MAGSNAPVGDESSLPIADEDFSSGGTAIRIASVAALGGLLFGYDSAVINGAVDSIQEDFGIGNAELGFAVASALLGAAAGAMTAGPDRRQDRPHLGHEDRRSAVPHQRIRHRLRARGLDGGAVPHRRRHRRRRRVGDRPCLHRRDVTSADPRPARLAAAVGDRVRHLPVVRHQLPAAIAGGRTERSVVARASTPGVGCSSRWRCPPSSTACWPSPFPSLRGIWLPATRFRRRGGCSTCCWARRTWRSPSTGSRNPSSARTSRRCAI